jgi:GxxExxY protein
VDENELSKIIIGAAIEVHRILGPGLLESVYEECLCRELLIRKVRFERPVPVPVSYKGVMLEFGYKLDVLVEDLVIIEIKSMEELIPVHFKQVLTYLRLMDKKLGLLLNFNADVLRQGVRRVVNGLLEPEPKENFLD